ncbi:MAG: DUF411 domain-containing protein [Phenylobacterium sp.]|uniref:DUF411 domain-containing protein n=1 Tax=Phenylobacterium sp. TaxID=1871053 RepID=UPI001209FE8D|nr:DUF411 domain-containing protein [Phenylobacterium sp.]TAL31720.1 MAG: DUF411 domain-containing protein [Phenylobacterium sp.]
MKDLSRRSAVGALAIAGLAPARAIAESPFTVFRTDGCQCCQAWVAHMEAAGYRPRTVIVEDLAAIRLRYKVPADLAACHTAVVHGYVVEGHVPAEDVTTLLRQRLEAIGIAVPGMPAGSPGMEQADGSRDAFMTLLLLEGGRRRIFARH